MNAKRGRFWLVPAVLPQYTLPGCLKSIYVNRGLAMLHSCRRVETSASGRYKREGEFFKFFMIIFYDSMKASGGGGRL